MKKLVAAFEKNATAVLNKWKQLEASGKVKKISDILDQGITDISRLTQDQLTAISQFIKWEDSINYGAGSNIYINE